MTEVPFSSHPHSPLEDGETEPCQGGEGTNVLDDQSDSKSDPDTPDHERADSALPDYQHPVGAGTELPSWVTGPLERALRETESAFTEVACLVAHADEFEEARRQCELALDRVRSSSDLNLSPHDMRVLLATAEDALAYLCTEAPDATALRDAGARVDRARDALGRYLVERNALRLQIGKYIGARQHRT